MTTLKYKVSEDGKGPKKTFAPPRKKACTVIPCSSDAPNNEDAQGIGLPGVDASQGQPKEKTQKKKEKVTRKNSGSDKEGKGPLATKTSKEQDAKGDERKTDKETTSLTNEQFEEIVQCVLKKSLQECLDMACETSCVQRIECSPGAKETSINTATTDVDRKLLGTPHPSRIPVSKEDMIVPETQSPQLDPLPSEKKQNILSLSKKRKEAKDEKTELTKRSGKHRRKGQPKKIVQGYTQISDQEEAGGEGTSDFSQCIAWVQCSFPNCKKWRQLRGNVDPSVLPDDWSCSQNTDLQFNHCDIPEETWSGSESDVVYTSYMPGSIIWAKQYGYPWWPGMIESDPDLEEYFLFASQQDVLPFKYHVTFFGDTASRAWIPSSMLKNFQELSLEQVELKRIRNKDCSQKLMAALVMAQEAQRISIQDRVNLFGFHTRYKENAAGSSSSEEGGDLIFQEARKPQRVGSSNSDISKEENKETSSTNCNPAHTSKKKLKLKDEEDETPRKKKNKRSPSQDNTSVEREGSSGNSQPAQPGLKKKFTTPQRKTTTVTRLPGRGGDRAPQNQSPPTQSPAWPLVEAGKKSDPQWSPVLMSRNPLPESKASSDLNLEQLMEQVREGINQKEEQQAHKEEEDEISLSLSEE
ncbi:zinc finger CW-type PWWP domain protein 1 isoform X2 [Dromiciops gliroides]|uniref:zinc finger CW-type PWWP domain protein 1 isoform X2 n=1 Tax=Dromiciops gliroides TaxID=33562 RepID=UPI001CC705AE|nr:zinc finger CW-type PWWP domain protein 1 isoform X2 [Dromiciops gliroides]